MDESRWLLTALDSLADIYVDASVAERVRMAAGVERFNRSITHNPHDVGESRAGRDRLAFPPLLAVYFTIDESLRLVSVTDVARYGR